MAVGTRMARGCHISVGWGPYTTNAQNGPMAEAPATAALPSDKLDRLALKKKLDEIGQARPVALA